MECGACQLNCPTGALKVDSGVGCAYAIIWSALTGRDDLSCCGDRAPSSRGGDAEAAQEQSRPAGCCGEPVQESAASSPEGAKPGDDGDCCCG
jgi:hypothetical protein